MPSAIDATKPTSGIATTASVRANFANAKGEIETLQTTVAGIQTASTTYALKDLGVITRPDVSEATRLGVAGGDAILPMSLFGSYSYRWYLYDPSGAIPLAVGPDGTLLAAAIDATEIDVDNLDATSATIVDQSVTSLTFDTQIIAGSASDSWLLNYRYVYVIEDPSGNWSYGMRPNGQADFASLYAVELLTASYSVVAAGTNQATATLVAAGIVTVTGAASGTGIKLVPSLGGFWHIEHTGASPLAVYPMDGASLGSLSVNSPITVLTGGTLLLWQSSATRCGLLQASTGGGGSDTFVATGFIEARNIRDRFADTVNVYDLVTGLDPTGVVDNSVLIKSAHDAAVSRGYRYMYFPAGTYNASNATQLGNVIFVGDHARLIHFRKRIIPTAQGSAMPPSDVAPQYHLSRFLPKLAAATTAAPARVLLVGDSTTTIAMTAAGAGEYMPSLFHRRMAQQFGGRPFQIVELGIGGGSWVLFASATPFPGPPFPIWYTDTSKSWMFYVQQYGPFDMVVFNFGQNDGPNLDVNAMFSAISQVRAVSPTADFLFVTPYCPSLIQGASSTKAAQEGREYAAGIQRTYARRSGQGLLDFHRWFDVIRDGFDPCAGYMALITSVTTVTLPYTWPVETTDFSTRLVFASMSSMWTNGRLIFQLSSNTANLLIMERDTPTGRFAYTVQTIAGVNSVPRTVTTFDATQAGGNQLKIEVEGSHIYVLFNNIEVINCHADRFGGVFLPRVYWEGGATLSPTTAAVSYFVQNLYMPTITDDEEFGPPDVGSPVTGGNGINHITSVGIARGWTPVVESTRFA